MKLYKFRSLGDDKASKYAIDILETGKFWCSRFWALNDPMEGVYRLQAGSPCYRKVFEAKASRWICSFSAESALCNPLMWGYYANGFKGLAIEIEVADEVRPVNYASSVVCPNTKTPISDQVDSILCSKLAPWRHEQEYRFLADGDSNTHRIGTIKSVIFGVPYPKSLVDFDHLTGQMDHVNQYRQRLQAVAEIAKVKGYEVHVATMRDAKIEIETNANIDAWYAQ